MRDRIDIRKAGDEWVITRPRLGFGPPEVLTAPTGAKAHRRLRQLEKPRGGHGGAERGQYPQDGLAPHPHWEPYPYRYPRKW